MKIQTAILAAALMMACSSGQASVMVAFVDAGTGGPYDLTVNGVLTPGTCISPFQSINAGIWAANIVQISDFAYPQSLALEESAWLTEQFTISPAESPQIQEAIQNFWGAVYTSPEVLAWDVEAQSHASSINPAEFAVLVPVSANISQNFLIEVVPEPATMIMIGMGLAALGWRRRKS